MFWAEELPLPIDCGAAAQGEAVQPFVAAQMAKHRFHRGEALPVGLPPGGHRCVGACGSRDAPVLARVQTPLPCRGRTRHAGPSSCPACGDSARGGYREGRRGGPLKVGPDVTMGLFYSLVMSTCADLGSCYSAHSTRTEGSMLETVGDTPVVQLKRVVPPSAAQVWVKIEAGNPTGSYKDRMALAMIEGAERDSVLERPVRLLECTGGSTGSSLAFVCAVKGYRFTVITSDAYAREKIESMRAFGAEVLVEPSKGGRVTPDLWPRMRGRAKRLVETGEYYWLDQFNNPYASTGYIAMGRELAEQLPNGVDAFCGAVGTAGMIVGVGSVLRERFPGVRMVALEPDTSPVLSGGEAGAHGIDGIAAGFVPPQFDREIVREVIALPENEARRMARRLAREEGIFAGTSTGLNVLGAIELACEIGSDGVVATVASDTGFKYLDGDLYHEKGT